MEFLQAVEKMARAFNVTMLQICKYCTQYMKLSELLKEDIDRYAVADIFGILLDEVLRWETTRITLQEFLESFTSKNTYITDDELQQVLKTRKKRKENQEIRRQIIPIKRLAVNLNAKVISLSKDWTNSKQIEKWIERDCYRYSSSKITEIIILDNFDYIQFSYSLDYEYEFLKEGQTEPKEENTKDFKYYGEYSQIIYNQDTEEMLAIDCDGKNYASYTGFVITSYGVRELISSLTVEKTPVTIEAPVKEEFNNIVPIKTAYVSWGMGIKSNGCFYFDIEKMKEELSQSEIPNYKYIVKAVHLLSDTDFNYFLSNLDKVWQFDFLSKKNDDYSYCLIDQELNTYEGENHWDKVVRTCYIVANDETQEMYAINLHNDTFIGIPYIDEEHKEHLSSRMTDITPIKIIKTSFFLDIKYCLSRLGGFDEEKIDILAERDKSESFDCKEIILLNNDSYNYVVENPFNFYSFFDKYHEKYPDSVDITDCADYGYYDKTCFMAYNLQTRKTIALIPRSDSSAKYGYAFYTGITDQDFLVIEEVRKQLGETPDYVEELSYRDIQRIIKQFKEKRLSTIPVNSTMANLKVEYKRIVETLRPQSQPVEIIEDKITLSYTPYASDYTELYERLVIAFGNSEHEASLFVACLQSTFYLDPISCHLIMESLMEDYIADWLSETPKMIKRPFDRPKKSSTKNETTQPLEINPKFMPYAKDNEELQDKLYLALGKKTTEVRRFLDAIKKLFGYKEENNYGELNFVTMNALITDWLAPVSKIFKKHGINTVKKIVTTKTTKPKNNKHKNNKHKSFNIVGKQPALSRISNNPIEDTIRPTQYQLF